MRSGRLPESTPLVPELCRLSAAELARRIARGELSAREVVDAHVARIAEVNPRLNAVVLPLFDQARRDADRVDQDRARGRPQQGPLAGVPMTIKETIDVVGTPSSAGLAQLAGRLASADAPVAARLRQAGALFLGKTNIAQLLLYQESDNPLYGRTLNPWNPARSPGGSSGGEAAIIAALGSPLGLGSDIGGSIRGPAHYCGIHGFRPTSTRISTAGTFNAMTWQSAILDQTGPLARSVEDLRLTMRVLATPEERPWPDPAAVRIGELRIGYFTDDRVFTPSPAIARATREAAAALSAAGATVVEWTPPETEQSAELFHALMSADGWRQVRRILADSPADPRIRRMSRLAALSRPVRQTLLFAARLLGEHRLERLTRRAGRASQDLYQALCQEQTELKARFAAALEAAQLDALVCPPSALAALPHGATAVLSCVHTYCYHFNVLGMPAGVVAATRVRPGEETAGTRARDMLDRHCRVVERGSAGLPVGVQVAAPPWRDDVVLAVQAVLEEHFRRQPDFPAVPPL
jgi:fatty acid amide hydrolase